MRHFVRRNRDGRNRAPVVMLWQKAHGLRVRVIVVTKIGHIDTDRL